MRVGISIDRFHKKPKACDPDIPIPNEGPKYLSREELEEIDREPCEVCFPNWDNQ